jgi:hypothetical protein
MKDRADPYLDFRHLELRGTLLRPSEIKTDKVELTFLPDRRLNESERKRDQPQSVGSFHIHHGALQFPSGRVGQLVEIIAANEQEEEDQEEGPAGQS